ncbi:MAG: phosphoheptose isomerase family protein [Candidatus Latescibacterota bacterium]
MSNVSRRSFLAGSTAVAAAAMTGASKVSAIDAAFNQKFAVPEKCFMDQFYDGAMQIVKGIRDTQIGNIAKAMETAYELQRKGGKVSSHVVYGHYSMFAGSRDVPGQPWVLPQCGITPTKAEFDAMKKGDFLITNRVCEFTKAARERGVYVVGVTNNYYKFARTPPDFLRPSKVNLATEDISDLVIDSQIPYDNGLVHAPQLPQVALCPGSGISQFGVYWACTAALDTLIGTKGKGSASEAARKYLDIVIERFEMCGADRPKVDWITEKWADLVLGSKARMLVYGHQQQVESYDGARNVFVNDAYICSSSSMIADQFEKKANEVRKDDIVLIGAFTSDNADEISVARYSRSKGAYTVAFAPYSADGDASGVRLFKEVDDALNTYADERAGVIAAPGFPEKVSPVAGLTGDLVLWLLTAQWTDHMARRGEMPYYWKGYHEAGGQEFDKMALEIYQKRGY